MVENLPANPGDVGSVPVLGGPPGEGNGNPLQHSFFFFHSSILAWKISWTEEPGGLWFMGWKKNQIRLHSDRDRVR